MENYLQVFGCWGGHILIFSSIVFGTLMLENWRKTSLTYKDVVYLGTWVCVEEYPLLHPRYICKSLPIVRPLHSSPVTADWYYTDTERSPWWWWPGEVSVLTGWCTVTVTVSHILAGRTRPALQQSNNAIPNFIIILTLLLARHGHQHWTTVNKHYGVTRPTYTCTTCIHCTNYVQLIFYRAVTTLKG